MAAEYAWKRAMMKLKETLATLGMKCIGEMLGREEIDESSPSDVVRKDETNNQLGEQQGGSGKAAGLKQRNSQE